MFYPLLVVLELFSISGLTNGYQTNSTPGVKSSEIFTGTKIENLDHTTVKGFDYLFEFEEQNENIEEEGHDQLSSFGICYFHDLPSFKGIELNGFKTFVSFVSPQDNKLFILYQSLKIDI